MRVFPVAFFVATFVVLIRIPIFGFLLLSLYIAGATQPAVAAGTAPWQAEWERTIAGARKEGAVSLWGDMEITHPQIVAAFTQEFPFIKPITVTGRVGDLTLRILAERRAGKYLADLYSGVMGGAAFYEFYRTGITAPITSTFVLPEVTDGSRWLAGKHHFVDPENQHIILYEGNVTGTSIFFNSEAVKPSEFGSYWDLLEPKWKGRIAMFERTGSGFPSMTPIYYNPRLGPAFIKRLLTEMNVTVSRDRRQSTDGWQAASTRSASVAAT